MSALERLEALGETLPAVPGPAAAYVPMARVGSLVHTAGQLPTRDGKLSVTGRLGDGVDLATGQRLARQAALNVLAVAAHAADGDLDAIRIVTLTVFVASHPSFIDQHLVANGASDFLAEVLGDNGVHARSSVGVSVLPLGAPVEVQALIELLDL